MPTPTLEQIRAMFTRDQQVEVRVDGVLQYAGTIVGYTRNESFQVRDPETGTVCDYRYTCLTPAQ
jgi:hypothetical protein